MTTYWTTSMFRREPGLTNLVYLIALAQWTAKKTETISKHQQTRACQNIPSTVHKWYDRNHLGSSSAFCSSMT